MRITDFIEAHVPKLQITEKMTEAIQILERSKLYSLPVVDNDRFIGMFDKKCTDHPANHLQEVVRTDIEAIVSDTTIQEIPYLHYPVLPVTDRSGKYIGCIYSNLVIQKLLEQQQLLSSIIENSNDGILVINKHGMIELTNEAFVKLSGISKEQYLGKNIREIIKMGIFKKSSVTLRALKEERLLSDFQKLQNGIDVLVKATPMFDEDHRLVRVLANIHDITELIQSKKELEKTQILSEKYQRKIQELIEGTNHAGTVIVSTQMKEIMHLVEQIADTDSTVFISGESGAGKEIISREIHYKSKRAKEAFIKVNCGAIPPELLESELFGHEAGAFTGAKKGGKPGLFELADKGTLFLDEIGELPFHMQAKLLRFLQDRILTRVGGIREVEVDVRIITATNRDVEKMVVKGEFREDLYYRLNVIPIHLPPLRERKEEIIPLTIHFLNKFNQKYDKKKYISTPALDLLQHYSWKGNIRELSNLIERLVLTVRSDEIYLENLPKNILEENHKMKETQNKEKSLSIEKEDASSGNLFEAMEKKLILTYLEEQGSIRRAAKALGVSHTTLMRKMKKHEMSFAIRVKK
ncbi:sigma 54-interacting transcriptional regulator [Halalkalibacterium ligniniphilum]|uniref:sigma 54-interacting transcriptional regulator n=1 Tax=Halalkalibacterium ligniniphilum TaxID=1134413 RepID=UPI00036FB5FD|nr:sigma 54-interacting transcriptional regulator [Halalkalibacterium ligniniphilum]